jgi:hypothetical protein
MANTFVMVIRRIVLLLFFVGASALSPVGPIDLRRVRRLLLPDTEVGAYVATTAKLPFRNGASA